MFKHGAGLASYSQEPYPESKIRVSVIWEMIPGCTPLGRDLERGERGTVVYQASPLTSEGTLRKNIEHNEEVTLPQRKAAGTLMRECCPMGLFG